MNINPVRRVQWARFQGSIRSLIPSDLAGQNWREPKNCNFYRLSGVYREKWGGLRGRIRPAAVLPKGIEYGNSLFIKRGRRGGSGMAYRRATACRWPRRVGGCEN